MTKGSGNGDTEGNWESFDGDTARCQLLPVGFMHGADDDALKCEISPFDNGTNAVKGVPLPSGSDITTENSMIFQSLVSEGYSDKGQVDILPSGSVSGSGIRLQCHTATLSGTSGLWGMNYGSHIYVVQIVHFASYSCKFNLDFTLLRILGVIY